MPTRPIGHMCFIQKGLQMCTVVFLAPSVWPTWVISRSVRGFSPVRFQLGPGGANRLCRRGFPGVPSRRVFEMTHLTN